MKERERVSLWALSDLCTPWCVHVVSTLRIAEHMAAGLTHIEGLAKASSADANSLRRVLRHLASRGVFDELGPERFALNASARMLLEEPLRLALDLDACGGRMALAWGGLLDAVRTGQPCYKQLFGLPFWEDMSVHPELAASFDAMLSPRTQSTPDPDVLIDGDWTSISSVVDVGGGIGSLLSAILQAHPSVRGTLVEQPATIARAKEVFRAAGIAERVSALSQSFFDPLPAGADVYLLRRVLSDWPDAEVVMLLRRCAEAARPSGRVVVLSGVFAEDPAGCASDLQMLVLLGGRDRSLRDFRELATTAGLEVHATAQRPSGALLVECRPTAASDPIDQPGR